MPTLLCEAEGHTEGGAIGKPPEDPAQSETLSMRGNPLHGRREIPRTPAADGAVAAAGVGCGAFGQSMLGQRAHPRPRDRA